MTKSDNTEIELLKSEVNNVKEQNKTDHNAIMSALRELKDDLCSFKENSDKRYAYKDDVKDVKGSINAIWTVLTTAITIMIGFLVYIAQAIIGSLTK